MSFVFFNSVLNALGKRLNYDAVSNLAGNGFAKDAWDAIKSSNPLHKPPRLGKGMMSMLDMIKMPSKSNKKVTEEDVLKGFEFALSTNTDTNNKGDDSNV